MTKNNSRAFCAAGLACAIMLTGCATSQQTNPPQALAASGPATQAVAPSVVRPLPNHFNELLGITDAQVQEKIAQYWRHIFEGGPDQRLYFQGQANENGPTGYLMDIANNDIRSEGMSYGMMIAVQTGHKEVFNAIWNWAHTNMLHQSGPNQGYFRWTCLPSGCLPNMGPAPDGEEYFATALLFASARWGDGNGIYHYSAEANKILDVMAHKEEMNGGVVGGTTNMFNHQANMVVFVPWDRMAEFSDPSYHLPAFYEIWARRAVGYNGQGAQDRAFWANAADISRRYFDRSTHPVTGLGPDYAHFDGSPVVMDGHEDFRFDAFRIGVNWAVDYAWWGKDQNAIARGNRLLAFFDGQGMDGYVNNYRIDGTPLSHDRSGGLIASNAVVAALASDRPDRAQWVRRLWALSPPSGRYRYYDGLLQYMALLHVSGQFRPY